MCYKSNIHHDGVDTCLLGKEHILADSCLLLIPVDLPDPTILSEYSTKMLLPDRGISFNHK